jgi:hypothetical protein
VFTRRPAKLPLGLLVVFMAFGSAVPVAAAARRSSGPDAGRADGRVPGQAARRAGGRARAEFHASLRVGASVRAIPGSFLGLSVEYGGIARYEGLRGFAQMLRTLTVSGSGPTLVRLGGESADGTYLPPRRGLPGDYRLTRKWFTTLASLVRAAHLRLMFDLNLAARSPSMAGVLARVATAALPAGSIQSFEIGNEPDLFKIGYVGVRRIAPGQGGPLAWALGYTPGRYALDFRSYAGAVVRAVRAATFAGPSVTVPDGRWWNGLPAHGRERLAIVSLHAYPLLDCVPVSDPRYPTVARLLSPQASSGFAAGMRSAARAAHRRGAGLRLTEVGPAACGGVHGVTDAFAAALWVPDALFALLAAGVDGVNIHTRLDSLNTPLRGLPSLSAQPLWYGMVLFERALGPGARLLATDLRTEGHPRLSAWAVKLSGGALRVLLINKGARAASVALRLRRRSRGHALYLHAPSPSATSRLTLGRASLRADGSWDREQALQPLRSTAGTYHVGVPPFSAALVRVP